MTGQVFWLEMYEGVNPGVGVGCEGSGFQASGVKGSGFRVYLGFQASGV
jgi:hypothetical protein